MTPPRRVPSEPSTTWRPNGSPRLNKPGASPIVSSPQFRKMPTQHKRSLVSTAAAPSDDPLGSTRGERPQVVPRSLTDSGKDVNGRDTSSAKQGVETSAEAVRPPKRF